MSRVILETYHQAVGTMVSQRFHSGS